MAVFFLLLVLFDLWHNLCGLKEQQQPGKLLTYRAAQRSKTGAFVYGFPLSEAGLCHCSQKIGVSSANPKRKQGLQANMIKADAVIEHLEEACGTVWPLNRITTVTCDDWEDGFVPVLALVACDRPNAKYIPQDEQLVRLKEIMESEGFEEGPAWFFVF
ncbi:hypothetical protein B0H34DRAFT_198036 [Crassisporium funariophilum]|nr:hypothetical protein B0H34DRAFT_198036 [Crassisporium funariophilum]